MCKHQFGLLLDLTSDHSCCKRNRPSSHRWCCQLLCITQPVRFLKKVSVVITLSVQLVTLLIALIEVVVRLVSALLMCQRHLFSKLMKRHVPNALLTVLERWLVVVYVSNGMMFGLIFYPQLWS